MTKNCSNCSYYYTDGFCTMHLSYWNPEHTCPKWTDETLTVDYNFLYRLCKDYIKICGMYDDLERLKEEHPEERSFLFNIDSYDFFLQCCLNDLKRELSRWELRK